MQYDLKDIPGRSVRWHHLGRGGTARFAGFWCGFRSGCPGRAIRGHCGGLLCRCVWGNPFADFGAHGAYGGGHGRDRHQPCPESPRSLHDRHHGGPDPDTAGRFAHRPFRRLYPVFRDIRLHVRYRRHHYPDPDFALPGGARRHGRAHGGRFGPGRRPSPTSISMHWRLRRRP